MAADKNYTEFIKNDEDQAAIIRSLENSLLNLFFPKLKEFITKAIELEVKAAVEKKQICASPENDLLNIEETCKLLHIKRGALYDRINKGAIIPKPNGARPLFSKSEILSKLNTLKKCKRRPDI